MVKYWINSLTLWLKGTRAYDNSALDDKVVDSLIEADKNLKEGKTSKKLERKKEILFDYMGKYKLKPYQVTNILKDAHSKELVQKIVLEYELTDEQEVLLLSRENNILLLENYLAPNGYLDPKKRLSQMAEEMYVVKMLQSQKQIGLELFKTYVDNSKRTILTDIILVVALKNDCIASRYLLIKSYFDENQEVYLINNMSEDKLEDYISQKQLYFENSQALLVERYFNLAKLHYEKYGFRPKVMNAFRDKKKAELQELHPTEIVP